MSKQLRALGNKVTLPKQPDLAVLEAVPNPHKNSNYVVRFTCPEFTSICPITGQPDFAKLVIDYVPNKSILESKSLKLYLGSYRNHGAFHEDCTVRIAKDICRVIKPTWLSIVGYWNARGGIAIAVSYQTGPRPECLVDL
jgi:7-cyano-7-deazaguanine reductase